LSESILLTTGITELPNSFEIAIAAMLTTRFPLALGNLDPESSPEFHTCLIGLGMEVEG
jgi:hypothetical protein